MIHKNKKTKKLHTTGKVYVTTYQGKNQGETRGAPEEQAVTVSSVLLTLKTE